MNFGTIFYDSIIVLFISNCFLFSGYSIATKY